MLAHAELLPADNGDPGARGVEHVCRCVLGVPAPYGLPGRDSGQLPAGGEDLVLARNDDGALMGMVSVKLV